MIDLKFIKKFIEIRTGIDDLSIKDRSGIRAKARMLYCILATKYTSESYKDITAVIERKHCMVVYSVNNQHTISTYPLLEKAHREFVQSYAQIILADEGTPDNISEALASAVDINFQLKEKLFIRQLTKLEEEEAEKDAGDFLIQMTKDLTPAQLEKVRQRVEPIINMIKSEKYVQKRTTVEHGEL